MKTDETQPPAPTLSPDQIKQLHHQQFVYQTLLVMVRGILNVLHDTKFDVLMLYLCTAMGGIVGNLFRSDDLVQVAKFREKAINAFKDGVHAQRPMRPDEQASAPPTAG